MRGHDPRYTRLALDRVQPSEVKMTILSRDTDPAMERLQIERLRQMPAWRKLALVSSMNRMVRTLALSGLRERYPDDTPAQRQRRLAGLILGPELAAAAFGPGPEEGT